MEDVTEKVFIGLLILSFIVCMGSIVMEEKYESEDSFYVQGANRQTQLIINEMRRIEYNNKKEKRK